ncbi:MAG: hypothetical protein GF355_07210, partial [Candidatus Eisenbacteria bacterium]|nr:hypothetical protein [Candidatus Eisenbacteria bacterium]
MGARAMAAILSLLPRRWRIVYAAVLAAKLAALFLVIPHAKQIYPYMNVDTFPDHYEKLAWNLAEGNGYRFFPDTAPTMARTPGYPLLLAPLFAVFGQSLAAAKILNLLLSLLAAMLIADFGGRVLGSPAVSRLAPLIFLLHPAVILAESRGGPEVFLCFLFVLALSLMQRAARKQTWGAFLSAGLAVGAGALVKSTFLVLPAALLAARPASGSPWRRFLPRWALLCAAVLAVQSPWIWRNARVSGAFVPTMTVAGMSATQGMHICRNASLTDPLSPENYTGRGMNEGAYEALELAQRWGYEVKGDYFLFFESSADEVACNRRLLDRVAGIYLDRPLLVLKCLIVNLFN